MVRVQGPTGTGALRYIFNSTPIDLATVNLPSHIGTRDSGLGYGSRCIIIYCGGTKINPGVRAIRRSYPGIKVTANRTQAARWCHDWARQEFPGTVY